MKDSKKYLYLIIFFVIIFLFSFKKTLNKEGMENNNQHLLDIEKLKNEIKNIWVVYLKKIYDLEKLKQGELFSVIEDYLKTESYNLEINKNESDPVKKIVERFLNDDFFINAGYRWLFTISKTFIDNCTVFKNSTHIGEKVIWITNQLNLKKILFFYLSITIFPLSVLYSKIKDTTSQLKKVQSSSVQRIKVKMEPDIKNRNDFINNLNNVYFSELVTPELLNKHNYINNTTLIFDIILAMSIIKNDIPKKEICDNNPEDDTLKDKCITGNALILGLFISNISLSEDILKINPSLITQRINNIMS